MLYLIAIVVSAIILDLVFGEPRAGFHPVVIIGKLIDYCQEFLRSVFKSERGLLFAGFLLVVIIVAVTFSAAYFLILLADKLHPLLGFVVEAILLYSAISIKSLHQHAAEVAWPLRENNITAAREKLSMLVSRDTNNMERQDIVRGTVESVAENIIDGIIAPLFYAFIGGAPLALAYKAVNTLDSMIGYKEERYIHIGMASARLDDLANYLPARISIIFFLAASIFTPQGPGNCLRIIKRDASKHSSPNSGIPESAVAGSLGIKLGGINYYFGKQTKKEEMGDSFNELKVEHIFFTVKIMYMVTFFAVFTGVLVHTAVILIR